MKIFVKVKTGSKTNEVKKPGHPPTRVGMSREQYMYEIRVKARPVEGAANEEVIKLMSGYLGVPRSAVRVTAGLKSKIKTLEIGE